MGRMCVWESILSISEKGNPQIYNKVAMKESLEAILYYRASVTRDLYYQSVLGTVAHIYRAVADNTRAVACNEGTVAHNA